MCDEGDRSGDPSGLEIAKVGPREGAWGSAVFAFAVRTIVDVLEAIS